jgi:DNA/RNA endonuclease G (NUC1)
LCSAEDLRPLHLALLREWSELDDKTKQKKAAEFRKTAAKTGAWIKSLEERDTAQAMIDYWTAAVANIADAEFPKVVLLDEFKPATVQKLARKCPFVGLNAFQIRDASHYFGRTADIGAVIASFERNGGAVILGPSGMGKTSLAQAGVAGTLLKRGDEWVVLGSVVPGRDPVAALVRAVQPSPDRDALEEQRAALMSAPEKFKELAEARLSHPDQRLLIIVDRAEELFTSDVLSSEISVAVNAIASLVAGPSLGRHRILFTVRGDFLEPLKGLINSIGNPIEEAAYHRLQPPTYESLHDAIVKPAELESFKFDDQVVDDLAKETAEHPDAFPLLEFTLTYLWKRAEVDRVSWADYHALPKPSQLLSDVAEGVFANLPSEDARAVARVTLTELIRVGQDVTVRRSRYEDLERCVRDEGLDVRDLVIVLDGFVRAGLLRRIPGEDSSDARFELCHSAVIRHWPRLLIWLQDKRRTDASRERYLGALERWRAKGRSNRYLLPLWWLIEAGKYRGKNKALDEYIMVSRRWWTWLAVLLLAIPTLLLTKVVEQAFHLSASASEIERIQIDAAARDRADALATSDLTTQAMIADQALLRAVNAGLLGKDSLPTVFVERLALQPIPLPSRITGYDQQFLGSSSEATVPLPRINVPGARTLIYPHTAVIYDPARKIPLVVATNVDLDGRSLLPFAGIGFFADPRLPSNVQSGDRVSRVPNLGRVPLVDWREVGWAPTWSNARDASFVNYQPLAVLQPWRFYGSTWSMIDRRLFATDARRLTILAGPILDGTERTIGGNIVPQAYWKAAIHWDEDTGKLDVQAYQVRTDTPLNDRTLTQAITTFAEIAKVAGLSFGDATTNVAPAAVVVEHPTVYLQFAVMPRTTAVEISQKLAELGYHLQPEEQLDVAKGLSEVRYVRADDEDNARKLAETTQSLLKELGFGDVSIPIKHLVWVKKPTPPGVLELWLGIASVARLQANATYTVYGASDGFLSLRAQPSVEGDELARMRVGMPVKCGDAVDGHPGWRPCTWGSLSGFAFDRFLGRSFFVYGTDDGFLSLRVQPSAESEELARMVNGARVICGDVVAGHAPWRPCDFGKLNGYAFDAYLKPME